MASNRLKRGLVALALGGATLGLGGVATHTVAAQQAPAASPTATSPGQSAQDRHDQFLAAVAQKLNVSVDQLKQAMDQARQELGLPAGPEGRFGGPRGGFEHGGFGMGLDTAAQAIGISADQLRAELPGKSLSDVAKAHNVDPSKVADALKAAATSHVDQAVSSGRITADQAAQIKQSLSDRIDQQMTRQVPADAPQRGGPRSGGQPRQGEGSNGFAPRGGPRI